MTSHPGRLLDRQHALIAGLEPGACPCLRARFLLLQLDQPSWSCGHKKPTTRRAHGTVLAGLESAQQTELSAACLLGVLFPGDEESLMEAEQLSLGCHQHVQAGGALHGSQKGCHQHVQGEEGPEGHCI